MEGDATRGPETEPSHPMKVDGNRRRPRATAPDAPDARANDDRSHSRRFERLQTRRDRLVVSFVDHANAPVEAVYHEQISRGVHRDRGRA
jgi:hypothetical protein